MKSLYQWEGVNNCVTIVYKTNNLKNNDKKCVTTFMFTPSPVILCQVTKSIGTEGADGPLVVLVVAALADILVTLV